MNTNPLTPTPAIIDIMLGNIVFPVIIPGRPVERFPAVTYSLTPFLQGPARGITLTFRDKLITVGARRGQVLQFNFKLDAPSAADFVLLGIAFNSLPTIPQAKDELSGGGGRCGQGEFPAIIVSRSDPLRGTLREETKDHVHYAVTPNTLSVIDVNLTEMESVKYNFIIMVQNLVVSIPPPPTYTTIGIIDPEIENTAEE